MDDAEVLRTEEQRGGARRAGGGETREEGRLRQPLRRRGAVLAEGDAGAVGSRPATPPSGGA